MWWLHSYPCSGASPCASPSNTALRNNNLPAGLSCSQPISTCKVYNWFWNYLTDMCVYIYLSIYICPGICIYTGLKGPALPHPQHHEYQRDCGLMPPQNPMMLALEKEKKKKEKANKPQKCCWGCDTGERCVNPEKVRNPGTGDLLEY